MQAKGAHDVDEINKVGLGLEHAFRSTSVDHSVGVVVKPINLNRSVARTVVLHQRKEARLLGTKFRILLSESSKRSRIASGSIPMIVRIIR